MSISINGDGIISGVSTLTNPSEITVGTGASVFSPSANTLALGTNGSERVRIDSSGNFGLGTDTPRALLDLSSTSPIIQFTDTTSGSSERNWRIQTSKHVEGDFTIQQETGNDTDTYETKLNIDSSGNLGLNTTSPSDFNDAGTGGVNFVIGATGAGRGVLTFASEQTGGADEPLGIINFVDSDTTNASTRGARILGMRGSDANSTWIRFDTANSGDPLERMRISANGGTSHFATAAAHGFRATQTAGTDSILFVQNNSSSVTTGSNIFVVRADGDVENATGNYTAFSDQKLKENIVDANSQWDDIKSIQIRNFNFKEETGLPTHTQIGVIAQELEQICPNLVKDVKVTNDGEDTYKTVKSSILYMKTVKALQEAMERIETLETANASQAATIAALDARLTALEGN